MVRSLKKYQKLMNKFKYYLLRLPKSKITLGLEKLKNSSQNPLRVFLYWIFDVIGYAMVGFACASLIISLGWIGVGISIGMLRWLIIDFAKEIKNSMKE